MNIITPSSLNIRITTEILVESTEGYFESNIYFSILFKILCFVFAKQEFLKLRNFTRFLQCNNDNACKLSTTYSYNAQIHGGGYDILQNVIVDVLQKHD